jgi:hypothetical protein
VGADWLATLSNIFKELFSLNCSTKVMLYFNCANILSLFFRENLGPKEKRGITRNWQNKSHQL